VPLIKISQVKAAYVVPETIALPSEKTRLGTTTQPNPPLVGVENVVTGGWGKTPNPGPKSWLKSR